MNKYKICVNNEAESREAQELFFELGYEKSKECKWLIDSCIQYFATDGYDLHCWDDEKFGGDRFQILTHKEITLNQLRAIAVLHRNDVSDATHVDQDEWKWFISSDGKSYVFGAGNSYGLARWDESPTENVDLKPIQKPQQEQGLISGAEAKLAWAKGEDVEYKNTEKWNSLHEHNSLGIFDRKGVVFRLKPRTIKLEIEVPKPFQPKDGEECFILANFIPQGYMCVKYPTFEDIVYQFGAWRSEEEIKIVVEQYRKIGKLPE